MSFRQKEKPKLSFRLFCSLADLPAIKPGEQILSGDDRARYHDHDRDRCFRGRDHGDPNHCSRAHGGVTGRSTVDTAPAGTETRHAAGSTVRRREWKADADADVDPGLR
jgi:hypothetical protein